MKAVLGILLLAAIVPSCVAEIDCSSKTKFEPQTQVYEFTLPELPYDYTFLEPVITSQILYSHHDHHHQTYTDKLNDIVAENPDYQDKTIIDLLYLAKDDLELQRQAGGYYAHSLYWWMMTNPGCAAKEPSGLLMDKILSQWGSFENFKAEFEDNEKSVFGSGWTWACVNPKGDIEIRNTSEHKNPLMEIEGEICYSFFLNDVWEHAYYLKYMWDKGSYFENYWSIVDWELASYFYEAYSSKFEPVPV